MSKIGFCIVTYSLSLQILPDVTEEGETSAAEMLVEVRKKFTISGRIFNPEHSTVEVHT